MFKTFMHFSHKNFREFKQKKTNSLYDNKYVLFSTKKIQQFGMFEDLLDSDLECLRL
jgi:hypothetical protein